MVPDSDKASGIGDSFNPETIKENRQHISILNCKRKNPFVLAFFLLFLGFAPLSFGQQNHTLDSTLLYPYDIKFEGANVQINANYQYVLQTFVEYLKKNPSISVHVRGHVCCRAGKRISRQRARNVYRYLKQSGIPKDRLSHAGYSNTLPLADPEKTDEDKRRNRRVDFVLTYSTENH